MKYKLKMFGPVAANKRDRPARWSDEEKVVHAAVQERQRARKMRKVRTKSAALALKKEKELQKKSQIRKPVTTMLLGSPMDSKPRPQARR